MAPEDRDPVFEKALARHLRAKPSSPAASREAEAAVNTQASAGAPGAVITPGPSSHDPACPNPEVLAAYHERLLVPGGNGQPQRTHYCMRPLPGDSCNPRSHRRSPASLRPHDRSSDQQRGDHACGSRRNSRRNCLCVSFACARRAAITRGAPRAVLLAQQDTSWRKLEMARAELGAIAAILLLWVGFHESHPSTFELARNTQPAPAPAAAASTTLAGTPAPQSNELADRAKVEPSNEPRSQTPALAQRGDQEERSSLPRREKVY